MKILITGANGFIGRNLVAELRNRKFNDLYLYDMDSTNNSVVVAFCHNYILNILTAISNRVVELTLVYFDDVKVIIQTTKTILNNIVIYINDFFSMLYTVKQFDPNKPDTFFLEV